FRRPLLAGHAETNLRFLVPGIEVVVGDGPVVAGAVDGADLEVFRAPARGDPAPVHREAADLHRAGLDPGDLVPFEMIVPPGALAVVEKASAERGTGGQGVGLVSRLHHDD